MNLLKTYSNKYTEAAPLAVFRILFGLLMFVSIIRFWANGWIEKLYLDPEFHFHYFGFEWVSVPGDFLYLIFIICALSAIFISIGYYYRWAIVVFFVSFTYIELLDKTTYLNHYYFVSVVSFMMIWLPAHVYYSLDAKRQPALSFQFIPRWNLDAIKLIISIVYIYAGLAKLNSDWMLRAMPLTIWLPSHADLFLIGKLFGEKWIHFVFSWAGALYDLFIVFFLLWSKTRNKAYFFVVVFHLLTALLFPIGMFPYIMMLSALIFFGDDFHKSLINKLRKYLPFEELENSRYFKHKKLGFSIISIFLIFQLLFPFRYVLNEGNLYWNEKGYRFSWRVMLMEKTGYANFKVVDGQTGKFFYVQNEDFITAFQQKELSTQADFIVEYGKFLGNHFESHGHQNVEIYVESYAALNGRSSQQFFDPDVDIMSLKNMKEGYKHVIPLYE